MADFAALDMGQGRHARKVGLPQPALNPQTPERRTANRPMRRKCATTTRWRTEPAFSERFRAPNRQDGHHLAILMRSMHKARLPSRAFRTFRPELAKFFKECQRPPSVLAGGLRPNADKHHVHESFFKLFPLGRILPNGNPDLDEHIMGKYWADEDGNRIGVGFEQGGGVTSAVFEPSTLSVYERIKSRVLRRIGFWP